ncbi:MAG TPA: 50S ribosomal protein L32 [Firmicutes bacterium]|nr:50S ribosomal protein L32 [Bacillota bacterium]
MANPKRRWSKARTSSHRANWKPEVIDTNTCGRCRQPKLPHRVCLNCGYYDGRQVMEIKEKKKTS